MMREILSSDHRLKPCKCCDQNQNARASDKTNGNPLKPKSNSSWGLKGFTIEKKSKPQMASIPSKKLPPVCIEASGQKMQYMQYHSRVKRSLISDFPCSANAVQVHPHVFDSHQVKPSSSHDLFLELDHLRSLLQESKDRESELQCELLRHKENPRILELERELDRRRIELESLTCKIDSLQAERTNLSEPVASLSPTVDFHEGNSIPREYKNQQKAAYINLEMEVVELRRINKELQLQKRSLALRLSSAESQLAALAEVIEGDVVAKVQAEASVLRHTNEDLCKQVEGLQMSRLTEVEELAYLRWVNSCLRHELHNSDKQSTRALDLDDCSIAKCKGSNENTELDTGHQKLGFNLSNTSTFDTCNAKKPGLVREVVKWPQMDEDIEISEDWIEAQEGRSPRRRHSISGPKGSLEGLTFSKRRQSDGFICHEEMENEPSLKNKNLCVVQRPSFFASKPEPFKVAALDAEKRVLRIPKPPPRPSNYVPAVTRINGSAPIPPPPPPPPPPPKFSTRSTGVMQRAPEVAELYHSLMKRDLKKDSACGGSCDAPNVANVRSSMIDEIENRSSHLLAIKADVETQGEFVRSLIKEVNGAGYQDIEDVVAFVKWLDDELCFLVDERAVLKHFDWPEKKADTLREAAFGYRDLKKLESEVTNHEDDPRLPCDVALKKTVKLFEKMEGCVYNLLRTREVMIRHCTEFRIPSEWMLDTGIISKIKFASVKLAKQYMMRVATELQAMGALEKDPALEYMLLKGVRFAFRVHQFAGGFDAETMHAFEELRNLAYERNK